MVRPLVGSFTRAASVSLDVLCHRLHRAEVEGRALHPAYLARGDGSVVDGQIVVGVDLQKDVVDRGGRIGDASEGEETMVSEVDDGLLVGCGAILDNQFVGVGHPDDHLTREALLAIGTGVFHDHGVRIHLRGVPYLGVESLLAAVEAVGTVVDGETILLAVELETSARDAVGVASHEGR